MLLPTPPRRRLVTLRFPASHALHASDQHRRHFIPTSPYTASAATSNTFFFTQISSFLHSHVNHEWCDKIKLSNLLLPRKSGTIERTLLRLNAETWPGPFHEPFQPKIAGCQVSTLNPQPYPRLGGFRGLPFVAGGLGLGGLGGRGGRRWVA